MYEMKSLTDVPPAELPFTSTTFRVQLTVLQQHLLQKTYLSTVFIQ
jgi:hypothetical protein